MHPQCAQAVLEQQLGQHGGLRVGGLGLPGLFGALEQGQLLAQRIGTAHIATPYLEVGRGQREMGAGQISGFIGVLGFEFGNHLVDAGAGNVGNGAVARFVGFAGFVQHFGHLDADALAIAAVLDIQFNNRVGSCAAAGKKI